jgi:Ca2+-binding RTX toxin-like protein
MTDFFKNLNDSIFRQISNSNPILGTDNSDFLSGTNRPDRIFGRAGNDAILGGAGDDVLNGGDGDDSLDGDGQIQLIGLTDRNRLVSFRPDQPRQTKTVRVRGIDGTLQGIDFRPANGLLYGLTDKQKLYTINYTTGRATFVSQLSPIAFQSGLKSGFDFNPVPDRLRLVGSNDQNLRLNVDTGAIADFDPATPGIQPDTALTYAAGDVNAGRNPFITAAAYTNSFAPSPDATRRTTLYEIDSELDVLVRQGGLDFPANSPSPNSGQLFTIGSLGVNFDSKVGFDILSLNGANLAYAVSGSKAYTLNLETGAASSLGRVGRGSFKFVGLAATIVAAGNGNDTIDGGNGNDQVRGGNGNNALFGGSGNDLIEAGNGNDIASGGDGDDVVRGGDGQNALFGDAGNDIVEGGRGNDAIDGGAGNDALRGGRGNDAIDGNSGNDVILGEAGNDALRGGLGDDMLNGDGVLRLFGLTDRNELVSIAAGQPSNTTTLRVTGIDGNLVGIDFRPANNVLYGVSDTSKVYTINVNTGTATLASSLNLPFVGGQQSGLDFNPVPDRLRLVGSNDQNFRFNVDTGAVADFDAATPGLQPDRALAYAIGDVNAGRDPFITAEAYTSSFAPSPDATRRTTLYGIDANLDILVRQGGINFPDNSPSPNEGQLFTVGSLGIDFATNGGFDILSAPNGVDRAIAVSNSTLYSIDLTTGAAMNLGPIGSGTFNFVGFAATVLEDSAISGNDELAGGAGNDILTGGAGVDQFRFASGASFVATDLGIDRITDFTAGTDTLVLSKTTFAALTSTTGSGFSQVREFAIVTDDSAAATSTAFITYSQATGNLFYNSDGATAGFGSGGQFATLTTRPTIQASDVLIVA